MKIAKVIFLVAANASLAVALVYVLFPALHQGSEIRGLGAPDASIASREVGQREAGLLEQGSVEYKIRPVYGQLVAANERIDQLLSDLEAVKSEVKELKEVQRGSSFNSRESKLDQMSGPRSASKAEDWFWSGDYQSGEFSLDAPDIRAEAIECRGSWCRVQVRDEDLDVLGDSKSEAELVLFEKLVSAAGHDLSIRQANRSDGRRVYFATPAPD